MDIKVVKIESANRNRALAAVQFEISSDGEAILISHAHVLRNRQGERWVAMPSYSVQLGGGRYEYFPAVTFSLKLKRAVEDVILPAFDAWQIQQAGGTR